MTNEGNRKLPVPEPRARAVFFSVTRTLASPVRPINDDILNFVSSLVKLFWVLDFPFLRGFEASRFQRRIKKMGAGASTNDPIDQEDKDERTDEHDKVWKKSNLRKRTVRHIQKMLEEKKRKNHSKRHFNKEKREVERKESEARLRKTNTKRVNTHETKTNITIVNENRRPIPPSSVENIEDDLLPPPYALFFVFT